MLWSNLSENSGAYKSFIATKDEVVAKLEVHNTHLQNTIVGLKLLKISYKKSLMM